MKTYEFMKLYELLRYLQRETEVPVSDVGKMAESLEMSLFQVNSVLGWYSGDKAISILFQRSNEYDYKWSLTEEGLKLFQLLDEAKQFL